MKDTSQHPLRVCTRDFYSFRDLTPTNMGATFIIEKGTFFLLIDYEVTPVPSMCRLLIEDFTSTSLINDVVVYSEIVSP